jgi:hypothetical protein
VPAVKKEEEEQPMISIFATPQHGASESESVVSAELASRIRISMAYPICDLVTAVYYYKPPPTTTSRLRGKKKLEECSKCTHIIVERERVINYVCARGTCSSQSRA